MRSAIIVVKEQVRDHMDQGTTGEDHEQGPTPPNPQGQKSGPKQDRVVDREHRLPSFGKVEDVEDITGAVTLDIPGPANHDDDA